MANDYCSLIIRPHNFKMAGQTVGPATLRVFTADTTGWVKLAILSV
jgi:hypothetical protein